MSCSICATIPERASANTGRSEHFTTPITSLKALGIGRSEDLWECPECEATFFWKEDVAWTGSGNNDEEVLTRYPAEVSSVIRAFIHHGERPPANIVPDAQLLLALPPEASALVASHVLRSKRALARELVPAMLDQAAHERPAVPLSFVRAFARREDAAFVLSELEERTPSPSFEELRAHCRRETCSTCRSIEQYPKGAVHRDALIAPFSALTQLRLGDDLEVWECRECHSTFLWKCVTGDEGKVQRVSVSHAAALWACLRRSGVVEGIAREMVFACDDRRELELVLGYGMQHDRELIRQLVPRMILELALNGAQWLHDLLVEFAHAPSDAGLVLDAISSCPRRSPLFDSLAAACKPGDERAPDER